jgi:hypothetical protein
MVQLGHVVPPDLLFRSYLFFTSSSERMTEHFSKLMNGMADAFTRPKGLVVEIGSNDGTALRSLAGRDLRILGVDPSRNLSEIATATGVPTIDEFFTEDLATRIVETHGQADLIVGCNVLGHIDDLDDVCRGVKALMGDDGAFVIEIPYLGAMLDRLEWDTIYHEHLSYFAVAPLRHLFTRFGLGLREVEFVPVHGGSIRCTVVHGDVTAPAIDDLIEAETAKRLADRETYAPLPDMVTRHQHALRSWLEEQGSEGRTVIGYGAPAKGSVLLNSCRIGPELLSVVLDSTPAKQGLHMPGTHQPILPPGALEEIGPDILLVLAWNHASEIAEREQPFRAGGGRLLTPYLDEL